MCTAYSIVYVILSGLSALLSRTPPSIPPAKPSRLSLPITRSSKVKSILSQRHSSSLVLCPSFSSLMQQQNSSSSPQTRSSYSPALLSLPASTSGSLSPAPPLSLILCYLHIKTHPLSPTAVLYQYQLLKIKWDQEDIFLKDYLSVGLLVILLII